MSRKRELIKQEIIAKLIMYNASAIVKEYLKDKGIGKHKRKHDHQIDFSKAMHKCQMIMRKDFQSFFILIYTF